MSLGLGMLTNVRRARVVVVGPRAFSRLCACCCRMFRGERLRGPVSKPDCTGVTTSVRGSVHGYVVSALISIISLNAADVPGTAMLACVRSVVERRDVSVGNSMLRMPEYTDAASSFRSAVSLSQLSDVLEDDVSICLHCLSPADFAHLACLLLQQSAPEP